MSRQQFVMDSRLPVSDTQSESDPNHPKNLAKNTQIVSAQASADTRYDIYPPPRVESFSDQGKDSKQSIFALLLISVSIACIAIIFCLKVQGLPIRIVLVGTAIACLHYAVGKMENLTV